jgi:hypothetical protein
MDERMIGTDPDPAAATTGRAVAFNAGIEGSVPATRTTGGGDLWVENDGVGIYMVTTGGTVPANVSNGASNVRYVVADATTGALNADLSATPIEYPAAGSVDFVAYYPHSTTRVTGGTFNVDLTDQSDQAAIDVLTAKTPNIAYDAIDPITLEFKHVLSKITINIKAGEGVEATDVTAMANGDATLVWTPGSAAVNLNNGSVTAGTNARIDLAKVSPAASGFNATFTAIVAPSSGAGRHLSVVVGGRTIVWSIPMGDTFTPGNHYVYSGTVTESNFSVSQSTITAWGGDGTPSEMNVDKQNNRITWDATNSRYILTTDPADAGLFFKFGGVVGIFSGPDGTNQVLPVADVNVNHDTFDPLDVAWDPTGTVAGTEGTGWGTVPVYNDNGTDFNLSPNTVTPPLYHTKENVKLGKGDPCRLVGLDLAKIKNAADVSALTDADIDNGVWRLPTEDDNKLFSGRVVNGVYTEHWTEIDGINGGMFPDNINGNATTFLPAAGFRNPAGRVEQQSAHGDYWSSKPTKTTGSFLLFYAGTVHPLQYNPHAYGFPIRCVRQ